MMREYIDFNKNEIPVIFDINLGSQTFTMGLNYNRTNDFFTASLWDAAGKVIVLGEKIVLGVPLFNDLIDERLPGITIVPMDESGHEKRVGWDNFCVTVFLYLDDIGPVSDVPNPDGQAGDNLVN